jgi:hypothetical protein
MVFQQWLPFTAPTADTMNWGEKVVSNIEEIGKQG